MTANFGQHSIDGTNGTAVQDDVTGRAQKFYDTARMAQRVAAEAQLEATRTVCQDCAARRFNTHGAVTSCDLHATPHMPDLRSFQDILRAQIEDTSYAQGMASIGGSPASQSIKPAPDLVNQPPHYTKGGIECIEAIEAALTPEEYRGYLKGNVLKYNWRCNHKGGIEDLKKARWYLERLITFLGRPPVAE